MLGNAGDKFGGNYGVFGTSPFIASPHGNVDWYLKPSAINTVMSYLGIGGVPISNDPVELAELKRQGVPRIVIFDRQLGGPAILWDRLTNSETVIDGLGMTSIIIRHGPEVARWWLTNSLTPPFKADFLTSLGKVPETMNWTSASSAERTYNEMISQFPNGVSSGSGVTSVNPTNQTSGSNPTVVSTSAGQTVSTQTSQPNSNTGGVMENNGATTEEVYATGSNAGSNATQTFNQLFEHKITIGGMEIPTVALGAGALVLLFMFSGDK